MPEGIAFPSGTTAHPGAPGRWRSRLAWLASAWLGAILLVAAYGKALDPVAFADQVRAERLDFLLPAETVALVALALEGGLGIALVAGLRSRAVLGVSSALVLFFLFLTGRAAVRLLSGLPDPAGGCGCFGNLVERTPTEAFVQDLLLMVPAQLLAWWGAVRASEPRRPRLAWTASALGAAVTVAAALAAPSLPLDDLATRLRPGARLAELCAGRGGERICLADAAPELASGRHLVVIGQVDDPGLAARVPELNAWSERGGEPPVALLADFDQDRLRRLYFEWAPAFSLHPAPQALLRPLYRRLPRSFLVDEGRVVATYSGLPPQLATGSVSRGDVR